jgi:opacity protein-like surface antigen
MLKILMIGSIAGVLSIASVAHAQALPTASTKGELQVGVGWSYATPDYAQRSIQGVSGFGDFNISMHYGVEAVYHYIALETPTDFAENSFLVGPRVILPHGRFSLYGKALLGIGDFVIQEVADNPEQGAGTYFAYAIGGGLDFRATRHIVIRPIDYEYQHWSYSTGLTPAVITFGVAYRFR